MGRGRIRWAAVAIGTFSAAVTGTGVGLAAARSTTHTVTYVAHSQSHRALGAGHLVGDARLTSGGQVVGYAAATVATNYLSEAKEQVALALKTGTIEARLHINPSTGSGSGTILGGTGAYSGITGTVTANGKNNQLTLTYSN